MLRSSIFRAPIDLGRFAIALFDETPPGDGAQGGGGSGSGNGGGAAGGAGNGNQPPQQRNESNAEYERRIADLKNESIEHRQKNKELKSQLDTVKAQVDLSNRRAIRAEAKVALSAKGAVDSDVVDLYLKWAGDKVKVDETTGEIVGIESIEDYVKAKPAFFKAVDPNAGKTAEQIEAERIAAEEVEKNKGKTPEQIEADRLEAVAAAAQQRPTSTSRGASPTGGGAGTGAPKIANFRDSKIDADAMLTKYANTLR